VQNHILSCNSADYPELLKQQSNYPMILYVMGEPSILKDIQIAMVGSRSPTPTGKENAHQFAQYLASMGLVITSGMAMGIDAASHEGALQANGKTIAIAGTGIDRVYPASHKDLAHRIVKQGAIVSGYPLGTPPHRKNFPKRNGIISALSVGTIVVEAALRSGSLITARLAMEQGREVFAIPGSIHNPLAKGCHSLIKQGAKLVETAQDIFEEIQALTFASSLLQQEIKHDKKSFNVNSNIQTSSFLDKTKFAMLPKDQALILKHMDDKPISLDQLQKRCKLPITDINALIVILEIESYIESLPGGKFSLKHCQ